MTSREEHQTSQVKTTIKSTVGGGNFTLHQSQKGQNYDEGNSKIAKLLSISSALRRNILPKTQQQSDIMYRRKVDHFFNLMSSYGDNIQMVGQLMEQNTKFAKPGS